MPDFDAKAFLADVLAHVPDDKKQAVEEALTAEPVVKQLADSHMRQSDYSRQLDALRQEREKAEQEIAAEKQKLTGVTDRYAEWYENANKEYADAVGRLKRYQEEYGDLEDPATGRKVDPDMLTKDQAEQMLAKALEQHSRLAVQFADVLTDIKHDYRSRFEEPLNTEELYAHREKTGLPIKAAYEDFIRPRVDKAQQEKFEEQLKQAREEGAKEALSQAQLPTNPRPSEHHALNALEKPQSSEDRINAAVAAWHSAN